MKRKKASDVLEVKELDAPFIRHTYDKSTMWKEQTIILHIVDRGGHVLKTGWTGRPEKKRLGVTRCNLVEDCWENGGDWSKLFEASEWDGEDGGYKFCPRCGTPDDFDKAMKDREQVIREYSEKYKQEQEEEQALRAQKWSRTKSTLLEIRGIIREETGFRTDYRDNDGHFSFEYDKDGRTYLVKVSVQEISELD